MTINNGSPDFRTGVMEQIFHSSRNVPPSKEYCYNRTSEQSKGITTVINKSCIYAIKIIGMINFF